jgi:flagellar hook-associated protein 3 FlgL
MRVNPNQWAIMLDNLNQVTQAENEAIREVSTGSKLNQPSDDPAAMAMLIQNRAAQSYSDQYQQNITTIRASMQTADSALSSVITSLTRAITLGTEGAGGTVSATDRTSIANEVSAIRDQLLSLANSTFNGSYIFGGSETSTPPFVLDSSDPSGVKYQGDTTTRQVPTGDGSTIAANKPGDALFITGNNVFGAIQGLITALQSGSGIDTATESVRSAFDHVSAERVFYGTSMQQLDSQSNYQSSSKLQLQTQENNLSGVDLAEAIGRLTNAENARNATLAATSQIGRTSLLDYLGGTTF